MQWPQSITSTLLSSAAAIVLRLLSMYERSPSLPSDAHSHFSPLPTRTFLLPPAPHANGLGMLPQEGSIYFCRPLNECPLPSRRSCCQPDLLHRTQVNISIPFGSLPQSNTFSVAFSQLECTLQQMCLPAAATPTPPGFHLLTSRLRAKAYLTYMLSQTRKWIHFERQCNPCA